MADVMRYDDVPDAILSVAPDLAIERAGAQPHVALGFLMSYLGRLRRSQSAEYARLLAWTTERMEELAQGGQLEVGLVIASFFDNLHLLGQDCGGVVEALGPNCQELRRLYERTTGPLCPERRASNS